jgi:N-acetyl-alpha-D-glucosaminyl L-malate synthase BshA
VDVGRYPLFEFQPYDLALAVRMHEVVRTHGLELLHCHYAIPHATSAWIAREMLRQTNEDVHLITTLHGTDITIVGQDPSFYPITKFSIEKSDRITAVSEYLREETCRAFGCERGEIDVIHNFIDPDIYNRDKYPPLLKNQFGPSKPILMHVSNFRAVKRVRDVIRIYAEVNRELPSVLVMIGDGPDRPAAEEEARMLGVEDSVSFLGKLDQIAPLLAAADLFLLPSQSESFGLSALEALASGVPVVGSSAGGLPEVVRDGETGVLCPVGDIPGMAAASLEILSDRKRWMERSRLAITDARERFSRDAIVTKYESLYRQSLPTQTP